MVKIKLKYVLISKDLKSKFNTVLEVLDLHAVSSDDGVFSLVDCGALAHMPT